LTATKSFFEDPWGLLGVRAKMRSKLISLALIVILPACSPAVPPQKGRDDLYSRAMRSYDDGRDAEALSLLTEMVDSDDPKESKLGSAILEDIYMTQAHQKADPEAARKALLFDDKIGDSPRPDLQAYGNYQRAVALNAMGDQQAADRLLQMNCQNKGEAARCVLVPEFARAVEIGPRYQLEAIYSITSVLIAHQFDSDAVLATNLAAMVRYDYARARTTLESLRARGKASKLVESEYCIALGSIRQAVPADIARCTSGHSAGTVAP
jgi:hypothetical protein